MVTNLLTKNWPCSNSLQKISTENTEQTHPMLGILTKIVNYFYLGGSTWNFFYQKWWIPVFVGEFHIWPFLLKNLNKKCQILLLLDESSWQFFVDIFSIENGLKFSTSRQCEAFHTNIEHTSCRVSHVKLSESW